MISLLNGALEAIICPIYKYAAPTALGGRNIQSRRQS
jgi:hypothetical protein